VGTAGAGVGAGARNIAAPASRAGSAPAVSVSPARALARAPPTFGARPLAAPPAPSAAPSADRNPAPSTVAPVPVWPVWPVEPAGAPVRRLRRSAGSMMQAASKRRIGVAPAAPVGSAQLKQQPRQPALTILVIENTKETLSGRKKRPAGRGRFLPC